MTDDELPRSGPPNLHAALGSRAAPGLGARGARPVKASQQMVAIGPFARLRAAGQSSREHRQAVSSADRNTLNKETC